MLLKKKSFVLICLFFVFCIPSFGQKCSRCNGRGIILQDPAPVSHYGVGRKVGDCQICGRALFSDESHKHVVCPSCNGTGKYSTSNSSGGYSSNDHYDGILTPQEYFQVESLAKILFTGKTEMRQCQTCHGTGKCPSPGLHHYGNMYDLLDLNAPTPQYCPLCGGWGTCPNRNCVNGFESYTRPCTENEKNEISSQIRSIYENAYRREGKTL